MLLRVDNYKKGNTMKKIAIGIAAVALTLTACSSGEATDTVAPAPIESTKQAPPPAPPQSNDDRAYELLQERAPTLATIPKSAIDDFADVACDAFDSGVSLEKAILLGFDSGFDETEVGVLLGYSIVTECPEYQSLLN